MTNASETRRNLSLDELADVNAGCVSRRVLEMLDFNRIEHRKLYFHLCYETPSALPMLRRRRQAENA